MGKFADWKEAATPDEVAVSVCFNRRLFRQFTDLAEQLDRARDPSADDDQFTDAIRELAELKAQVEADRAEHTFVFATLPYDEWQAVSDAHQPTDEQKREHKYLEYDPERFPQAAIAAACRAPELTVEDAEWLRQHLPRGEFQRLFAAVLQVNVGGSSIPKSVADTVDRLAFGLNSTTQLPTESPSPSSEDAQ